MQISITDTKYKFLDSGMTNFDYSIDKGLVEALQSKKCYAHYAGWNFCGYVYWNEEEKKYICEIWQYHEWTDTVKADGLEEIMEEISATYGYK